jgi:diadenosine tetraphosphatase ApaH/serine/threonine PP2A family protein phosphatase
MKRSTATLAAVAWTRAQLGDHQRAFLASLPLTVTDDNILFVHASAAAPGNGSTSAGSARRGQPARRQGDVHPAATCTTEAVLHRRRRQVLAFHPGLAPIPAADRRWLAIVGSAGQPRDGNSAACYALFDGERERLTFYRIVYDHTVTIRKIRAAGLPERLALRLERGA